VSTGRIEVSPLFGAEREHFCRIIPARSYRCQQFGGSLEAPAGILLEESLNKSDDWPREIFDSLERQGCMLMLGHHFCRRTPERFLAGHHLPEHHAQRVKI
jgi:hypothetical protein